MTDTFAHRLHLCREESGETLEQIGTLAGVNRSTVLRWERGVTTRINHPTLLRLAQHFSVDPDWLAGEDVPRRHEDWWQETPVVTMAELTGQLPQGGTALHQRPVELPWGSECFWLRVEGNDIAPLIHDGDLVLVQPQPIIESGRYAVVTLDGQESLIRRVDYGADWIELRGPTEQMPVLRLEGAALGRLKVVGPVLECKHRFV